MSVIKKPKKKSSEENLDGLTKEELILRVKQLIAHNNQLKNVISKKMHCESSSEGKVKKGRNFDFSKCSKRHIFIKILYLGWDYQGFATQEDTNKTIEFELFEALKKSCLIDERTTSNYHRCGRTDKGVSAFGQVISIDVRSRTMKQPNEVDGHFCETVSKGVDISLQEKPGLHSIPIPLTENYNVEGELEYCKILNRLLPPQIRAIAWSPVPPEESARFNCRKRTYKYFFPRGNLNLKDVEKAATHLVGEHDFRNLCKMDVANGVVNFQRKILGVSVQIHSYDQRAKGSSNETHVSEFVRSKSEVEDISSGCMKHSNETMTASSGKVSYLIREFGSTEKSGLLVESEDGELKAEKRETNSVKEVDRNQRTENPYDMCELTVVGQAFLWHQIRCIVSVLFLVGQGKEDPSVVKHLLDVESFPRKPQYCLASEIPLNLFATEFNSSLNWVYDRDCICGIIRSLQKEWSILSVKSTMVREMINELEVMGDIEGSELTDCLLQGIKSRTYVPLLQRNTCESLDDRINHFVKRKRLELEEENE